MRFHTKDDLFRWQIFNSRILWIILAVLVILTCNILDKFRSWRINLINIAWIHNVDNNCHDFTSSSLELCPVTTATNIYDWERDFSTDCQLLWLSRYRATKSLQSAQQTFERSTNCSQHDQVAVWGGELAWLQGNQDEAAHWWQQLSSTKLIDWGSNRLSNHEVEQGKFLLTMALEFDQGSLTQAQRSRALLRLGDALRSSQNWSEAIYYYQTAYQIAPDNPEVVFNLGLTYRQNGQPKEAIATLEQGLILLPPFNYGFNAYYYVQLGLAYQDLELWEQAVTAYKQAVSWLHRSKHVNPEEDQFFQGLLDQAQNIEK
jgi:tetratricopeptide (TPR) repeat protein